jgi:hypothetical protein
MTEDNLIMLYGGKQFDTMVDIVPCEYTGCKNNTDKILCVSGDIWQFCFPHFKLVLNAFCRVSTHSVAEDEVSSTEVSSIE